MTSFGSFISKELSVYAWKCHRELWYFCGPTCPQAGLSTTICMNALTSGCQAEVGRALSSGWDRLILQALREGRTRCHLIIPALALCQARMNSPSFQCLFVFFWSRCGKGKLEDGDGINLNDIEKVLPVWQVGAGAVST